jgi:hypothetical protein
MPIFTEKNLFLVWQMKVFVHVIIFFVLFGVFSGISSGIMGYYLYSTSKREIGKIEKETAAVAETLTDASAKMAELGRAAVRADQMNQFFKYNLDKKLFYKAFFVLENGTIVAHSNPLEAKDLRNNIAADEFRYNLDQIYRPIRDKSINIYFTDYFIMDKTIPFTKNEMRYLKKYLYTGIDRNGWLANKTVYENGKAVGTVNFLIGKDTVYSLVRENLNSALSSLPYLGGGSCILSLFLLILFGISSSIRGRNMQPISRIDPESISLFEHDDIQYEPISLQHSGDTVQFHEIPDETGSSPTIFGECDENEILEEKRYGPLVIQDAIPVRKRR